MHDVFVNLLVHQKRLDERAVSSLLYRIASNLSLNKIRSQSRRPEDSDSEILMKIADATCAEERTHARTLLGRAFRGEPVSTATIAVMHLHDGMTLQEVADAVGMSISGVRKRLRKLKGLIVELEGSNPRGGAHHGQN